MHTLLEGPYLIILVSFMLFVFCFAHQSKPCPFRLPFFLTQTKFAHWSINSDCATDLFK